MNENLINKLEQELKNIFKKKYNLNVEAIEFEIPKDIKNGNLSTNIALKNSKSIKKAPILIAEEIVSMFDTENKEIEKIEFVKPGFINFYFSNSNFKEKLEKINHDNYLNFNSKNMKINVEYVSANPTGALHLGHARNAAFGDSLANILKKVGYDVFKEYYINDAGVQMKNLGYSVKAYYLELCGETLNFPEDGYKGQEIKDIAKKLYEEFKEEKTDAELSFFIDYGYKYNLKEIKNIMQKLNINFDFYASEKFYHDNNLVAKAIDVLRAKDEVYEKDGAIWLKTSKYGDDKDRVLQKSDGTHTYLTSDIAYHADKLNRGADLLIDIWGGDHHGYIARVKAVLEGLGFDQKQLEVELIQMVSIFNGNEKVKMSKRAGTSVTIEDLLKMISPEVLRYFFVMRTPDSQLDFDLSVAQKENSDNPVFYIQYAHARINKILETYGKNNLNNIKLTEEKLTISDKELIVILEEYKEELKLAAKLRRPHLISNYLYILATKFHKYYNQEKILNDDEEVKENKLLICKNVQKIIADGLSLLGIKAKDSM